MAAKGPEAPPAPVATVDAPTAAEKLQAFEEVIRSGEVPAPRVAEMAGVTVADVEAFEEILGLYDAPPPAEPPPAVESPLPGEPPAAPDESFEDLLRRVSEYPKGPEAPPVESDPEPEPEAPAAVDAPRNVRVIIGRQTLLGPTGRQLKIRRRDVYGPPLSRFLWEFHRDLVEPYPHDPG